MESERHRGEKNSSRSPSIRSQTDAGELPARGWGEEVSITGADVRGRRRHRTSAQNKLIAHKFSVIFAERAGGSFVSGIGNVGAARPLPNIAEELRRLMRVGVGWQRLRMQRS